MAILTRLGRCLGHSRCTESKRNPRHQGLQTSWAHQATVSTELTGQAFTCLTVDYFSKAAQFTPIPDKIAYTATRAVHDY